MNGETTIAVYADGAHPPSRKVRDWIAQWAGARRVEYYEQITDLVARMRRPRLNIAVIVVVCENRAVLRQVVQQRHLFDGMPMILVLPDYETETLSIAHKLYPRFLNDLGSDPSEVTQVMDRMLRNLVRF